MGMINIIFLLFSIAFCSFNNNHVKVATGKSSISQVPSSVVQYWNEHVSAHSPPPEFLLSKASPLTAAESAKFSRLVEQNLLSPHLFDFCKKANLNCDTHITSAAQKFQSCRLKNYVRSTKEDDPDTSKLFFREAMLKTNVIMPMPDLIHNMPKLSFLPRQISSKLPFSTSSINEIKNIFHVKENDTTIACSLGECERAPFVGETKKCVTSMEDMIDFATGILGPKVSVKNMETTKGSNSDIMVGKVKSINGGRITKAVSCHGKPFPYLVYYCHSVPKVRVYEVDILDPVSKAKINHGVAVCHVDTSYWSPGHVAFRKFKSAPGKIEVCHWTFESGIVWTIAD